MNRLASATSPYLLQHADNPVHWWEWEPAAFAEARERDVPVLLSVGYAACHWCHVMAHESFEDDATAAYLNEHFVSVKVDREERPDVDAVYMQATVAMVGNGGWPMTCVLDHDGTPFFAGTYFPDAPRHGQPSFRQLLEAIVDAWDNRRDEIASSGARIRDFLRKEAALESGAFDEELLAGAVETLAREFDATNGGFGGAPKFPPSMVLAFLQRHHARTGSEIAKEMVDRTCEAMARGGMYDQLGGGFARYSVDARWVVPHFEKMLYDNAQLLSVYADQYAATGDELSARIVRETATFVLEELAVRGVGSSLALASSLDADSDGAEGTFYVWTPSQLVDVLGEDDGRWAAELLGVSEQATFEMGSSTLQRRRDPDDQARWVSVWQRLHDARGGRTRPARDDKAVTAWNGLAISGLVRAGLVLGEPRWVAAGLHVEATLERLHVVEGRLRRASRDGIVGAPAGVLEDYACLADAQLSLLEATGEISCLNRAHELLEVALDHFAADDGGFFDTADDAEVLVARPRDPSDNASPSGHSALVHALARYAAFTGSARHREAAEQALGTVKALAERSPRFAGWSLAAAELMLDGPAEIVVVSEHGEGDPLARIARTTVGAVSLVVTPDRAADSAIPLLEGRGLVDGKAAAYVCRNLVCQRPVTTVDELRALLGRVQL